MPDNALVCTSDGHWIVRRGDRFDRARSPKQLPGEFYEVFSEAEDKRSDFSLENIKADIRAARGEYPRGLVLPVTIVAIIAPSQQTPAIFAELAKRIGAQ